VIRKKFKKFLKTSPLIFNLSAWIIYLYLKFVYLTTKWHIIYPKNTDKQSFLAEKKVIFALWHNKLAFSFKIFERHQNISGLASTHSDGKVITKITRLWGFKIIEGSTNKNPAKAIKGIIAALSKDEKIVVTPDGPRGPKYKINSVITKIAYKQNAKVIPTACAASNYFTLNSWDQMIIPKPFSTVVITIGDSILLSDDEKNNNELLENSLNQLTLQAEGALGNKNL
jgi:lysophospholipid acyltransferase (LPLAT)-like uncharacterized protein